MKKIRSLTIIGFLAFTVVTDAATINVTHDAATGPGSLTAAILALHDGDTIAFHIPPGAGEVHYIQTPPDGYPLITRNNITIDGYTQGGASPNTASIHAANNAALKIVLSSTNGNALSMYTAATNSWGSDIPNLGYGDDEQAILGFFHATNATVKGLVIQASLFTATSQAPPDSANNGPYCKAISFAANSQENGGGMCQNWRVSGCWFGVDPVTKQKAVCQDPFYGIGTLVATPAICIASYRTQNAAGGPEPTWNYNWPGTIGVAAGSSTPRAEFNIIITGYGFDSEGHDYRVSGNFFNVLPDGVTAVDMSVETGGVQKGDGYVEVGRNADNITFGTDGDGVNDAEEGNVCGPWANGGAVCLDMYGVNGHGLNTVIAGNYFNADINGKSFGDNTGGIVDSFHNTGTARFGSDFNGVSDGLEGNLAFNEILFAFDFPSWPTNGIACSAVSCPRRNSMSNCVSPASTQGPLGDGQTCSDGLNTYSNFIDTSSGANPAVIIPVIGGGTTTTTLAGTCGLPLSAPYTRLVVDLYKADPTSIPCGQQWLASFTDNSPADSNPAVGAFSFSTAGLGLTSGTKVTITVTYSKDTQPTIGPLTRAGNQTTISVAGAGGTYGILESSTLAGPYSFIAATMGTATFTDNNTTSFYRATAPTASGQTSPFSNVYTIP